MDKLFQHGMKWDRFERHVKRNMIRFATSRDKDLRSVAKLTEEHGIEAGCCWLAALEYARVNGEKVALCTATKEYERVAEKRNDKDLQHDLQNLQFGLSWIGYNAYKQKRQVWPVKYPFKKLCKNVGLLHFMLYLGLKNADTTCEMVAATAFKSFMEARHGAAKKVM